MTAGEGPIPLQVLNSKLGSVEDVLVRICDWAGALDDDEMSERGLFVFDWSDDRPVDPDAYCRVAAPTNPVTVKGLPDEIAVAATVLACIADAENGEAANCAFMTAQAMRPQPL